LEHRKDELKQDNQGVKKFDYHGVPCPSFWKHRKTDSMDDLFDINAKKIHISRDNDLVAPYNNKGIYNRQGG
jgi:hypothetical protein